MKQETFTQNKAIILAVLLIIAAIIMRLAPHPANFAPVAAVALFGGAVLPRKYALAAPLTVMVLSDMVIGMHNLIGYTWGSFLLIALIGGRNIKEINFTNVLGASLAASLLFFAVTNFGVWLHSGMYDLSMQGLIQCYYNALPFFRNTVAGDLMYSGVLFGSYALAASTVFEKKKIAQIVN